MNDGIHFGEIAFFFLLWIIPPLVILAVLTQRRKTKLLEQFAANPVIEQLKGRLNLGAGLWKSILFFTALVMLIIALTQPEWNPQPVTVQKQGRDVVFLIDVSKSMLADDLKPNRLERAKFAIKDCVNTLQGDRVGLVAFAGNSVVKCPLTLDYGFFMSQVENLSINSVSRGGTNMGDALRVILNEVFDDKATQFRDIILITDGDEGDDDEDSFPVQAASLAGEANIRLIAIGLGDEEQGRRIPVTDEKGRRSFMTYDGKEVWTKLNADNLREMAAATNGGKYLNVATGAFNLGEIYQTLIADAEKQLLSEDTSVRYEEKFQIFLLVAFILFTAQLVIPKWRKNDE